MVTIHKDYIGQTTIYYNTEFDKKCGEIKVLARFKDNYYKVQELGPERMHNEYGPASINVSWHGNVRFSYFNNNIPHNLNGPALIYFDKVLNYNTKYKIQTSYYIDGKLLTKKEWKSQSTRIKYELGIIDEEELILESL